MPYAFAGHCVLFMNKIFKIFYIVSDVVIIVYVSVFLECPKSAYEKNAKFTFLS